MKRFVLSALFFLLAAGSAFAGVVTPFDLNGINTDLGLPGQAFTSSNGLTITFGYDNGGDPTNFALIGGGEIIGSTNGASDYTWVPEVTCGPEDPVECVPKAGYWQFGAGSAPFLTLGLQVAWGLDFDFTLVGPTEPIEAPLQTDVLPGVTVLFDGLTSFDADAFLQPDGTAAGHFSYSGVFHTAQFFFAQQDMGTSPTPISLFAISNLGVELPEPGTVALLGTGLIGLCALKLRKRK